MTIICALQNSRTHRVWKILTRYVQWRRIKWSTYKVIGAGCDANIAMEVYGCNRVKGCSLWGQEPAAHTFKRTETWKFATNSKTYKTILHTPVPFRWNHILLVLSLVTQFCTNNSYSLNGNTLHYWLSYYEDYRHFEGILSLLSQSFELYVIVLHNIFTRDLWKTLKISKMTDY
jgi:hypothetical protein